MRVFLYGHLEEGEDNMLNKISFIGAGSMAEAIIGGMVKQQFIDSKQIFVSNKTNETRLEQLADKYDISGITNKQEVIEDANIIVFATKPDDLASAISEVKQFIKDDQLIVSVIAGVSTSYIQSLIDKDIAVIRTMPNTSATISYSATAIAKGEFATDNHIKLVKSLFSAIGTVSVVQEDDMHIVTGISGSGPAYIYYLVEAMEKVAEEEGLDKKTAKQLITQTIIGAGEMLKQSNGSAQTLRENVTSPNGTTAAGIQTLSDYKFQEAVINCVKSAKERSIELGEET